MKYPLLALCFATLAACRSHDHDEHPPPATAAATPGNAVQEEMRLLTSALQSAVQAVGVGDVRGVEHELHRVHLAKEATEAALHDGRYRLPRNPDKLERFHSLDEAFHADLERLAEASHKNDVAATAEALGTIVGGCNGCHSEFRR